MINQKSFFISSIGTFKPVNLVPNREPDFISGTGNATSFYYYEGDTLIRKSAHWGRVAKCVWQLKGVVEDSQNCQFIGNPEAPTWVAGKIKFFNLKWLEKPIKEDVESSLIKFKNWELNYKFNPNKPWQTLPWIKQKIEFFNSILNLINTGEIQ